MIIQKLILKNKKKGNHEKLKEMVESYLYDLLKNGQVWGDDFVLAWEHDVLMGYIKCPEISSINLKYNSKYANKNLEKIKETSGGKLEWIEIENDECKAINWKNEDDLYMFTHAFDDSSPVCAASNGQAVPLYTLGITNKLSNELVSWLSLYRELDNIWLNSSVLELDVYKEMAGIKSQFFIETQKIREELEQAISKPIYYYLVRYWGRTNNEENRLCPSCGNKWSHENNNKQELFCNFDFKCIECRLVSHVASSYDDERKAHIGEYRGCK